MDRIGATPWDVTLFLREVATAARMLDRGRLGDWNGVARYCDRWEFCETRAERLSFARRVASASRHYAAMGDAYCARLGAYYRAIALAAFTGARASKREPRIFPMTAQIAEVARFLASVHPRKGVAELLEHFAPEDWEKARPHVETAVAERGAS